PIQDGQRHTGTALGGGRHDREAGPSGSGACIWRQARESGSAGVCGRRGGKLGEGSAQQIGFPADVLCAAGLSSMKNTKGQSSVEMVFILPLLIMLAGGMLFVINAGWQDLKVQQAANLLARVEGQEKVMGGASVSAIANENGFGLGSGFSEANAD